MSKRLLLSVFALANTSLSAYLYGPVGAFITASGWLFAYALIYWRQNQ